MPESGQAPTIPPERQVVTTEEGHRIVSYSYGSGDDVVLCLNGGPGLPCDYLRDPHICLAGHGYRMVTFDQLGTGESDKPTDGALWSIERYAREVEAVRRGLDLGKIILLGHSWGGWLSVEYAVTYPENLRALVLEDTGADMPHLVSELNRLRAALGPETVAMMQRHEAEGTLDHPEYQAAITILNYRHVCRLDIWPDVLTSAFECINMPIYETMQGPNEFVYTGNLKNWTRLDDLGRVTVPTLITVGKYDELTPACALKMKHALPNAEVKVFPNSSHCPFYEEPEQYYPVLLGFLARCRAT